MGIVLFKIVSGPAFAMAVLRFNPPFINGSARAMLRGAVTKDAHKRINARNHADEQCGWWEIHHKPRA